MDCRRVRKSLMDYVDGGLSATRRKEVGRHLESCRECSALAERLKTSASALSALAPLEMPDEASRRVLATLKSQGRAAPAAGFFHSPRALAVAGGAALLLALAVIVGIFTLGGQDKTPTSKNVQQTLASGAAQETRTDQSKQSVGSAPAGALVLPVARITQNNYNQDSAKTMAENLEVKNTFAKRYSMSDVINLRTSFAKKLADDFNNLGGDGAMLEAMISFIQSSEPVLLPCYVEKAQFAGQNVYIIGLCGPPRSGEVTKLTRAEFWALNPEEFASNPEASLSWWGQSIKQ